VKRNSFLGIALILAVAAALTVSLVRAEGTPEPTFWGKVYNYNTGEPMGGVRIDLRIDGGDDWTYSSSDPEHLGDYSIGPAEGTGKFCLSTQAGDLRDAYWGTKTDPDPEYHDLHLDELGPECPWDK